MNGRASLMRPLALVTTLLILVSHATAPVRADERSPSGHWLMIETHVHSVFSSDAVADVGVLATTARQLGYDAVFLTDHNEGSAFLIEGATANRRTLDEDDDGWERLRRGAVAAATAQLESDAAYQGTRAFHLALTSPATGAVGLWARRGPLVTAGPVTLSFAVLVRHLDPTTGFAATISLGGDPVLGKAIGYTTARGAVLLGRSVTFAWTIGDPVLPESTPTHRVYVFPLSEPPTGVWTTYTVDVSAALALLPAEEQPHPFAAYLAPALTLSAREGSADLYLDAVVLEAQRPLTPVEEFVARTQLCRAFSDDSFLLLCAHEMGQQRHTTRFDFAIDDPRQFVSFEFGTDGIPSVHSGGYPTQLNHPGSTVRLREVLDNRAYGADFIEVRKPEWAALWDELLLRDVSLLGSWGTDSHELIDRGNPATFVWAETRTLDGIVRALYEGRSFLARNTFTGSLLLAPFAPPEAPYPARYPIFVSDRARSATIFLRITDGVPSGARLRWIRNGHPWQEHALAGPSADLTAELPLDGPSTVVRAELLDQSGNVIAMTQPLVFRDVPGLPESYSFHTDGITTLTGRGYARTTSGGITDAAWDPDLAALLLTLQAPPASRIALTLRSDRPSRLDAGGVDLPLPADGPPFVLTVFQSTATNDMVITFGPRLRSILRTPPAAPDALGLVEVDPDGVTLRWQPPPRVDRPLRYEVERDGRLLARTGTVTSYRDRSVRAGDRYTYTVRAVDLSGIRSAASPAVVVTIPPPTLIWDDFESGSLTSWTATGNVSIQARSGESENRALRLEMAGAPAAITRALGIPHSGLRVRFRFQLLDQGSEPVPLLQLSDRSGTPTVILLLGPSGRLEFRAGSAAVTSRQIIAFGVWYACQLALDPAGTWTVACRSEAQAAHEPTDTLTLPSSPTAFSSITIGQGSGAPRTARALLLIDDLVVRSTESVYRPSLRPWSWGTARGRA